MKDTMSVTVPMNEGEQAVFTIEFDRADFFKVVDSLDGLTLESVQNNPLWKII